MIINSQLNESASLQTIGLQNGNISLVDNKGNIYKAKLEKIGNKNDKKIKKLWQKYN